MATPLLAVSGDNSTTDNYMTTTERPLSSFPLYAAAQYLWLIYTPTILLLGLFGNVMIIIIMRRTSGESNIHLYLIATAVFDTLVLGTVTLRQWLRYTFGFDIFATHNLVCKIFFCVFTGSGTISAWCLVCLTVHRAMSVVWPHRVNVLCTRRTVLVVLAGITVFFALLYSHYLIGMETVFVASTKKYQCKLGSDDENYIYFFQNIFVYIELTAYSLLPFIALAVSNSVLIWKLSASVKAARKKLTQGDSEQVQCREKAANSVTLTVIVISMVFLVVTLPNSINFMLNFVTMKRHRISGYELARTTFVSAVGELLGQTNSSVNFYLYCLTGRRFREDFIKVMCCGRNRRQQRDPHQ